MKKPTASIALQVMPRAADDKTALKIIDRVIEMIKKSSMSCEVGPMETTMEGDLNTLLKIVGKAQLLCIEAGADRVFSNVKIFYNPSGIMTIEQKTKKFRIS